MFILLYFVPPFLAYRMGARGGWLVSIIAFSWPAFAIWLIARRPTLFAERERQREAAEFERTLMIVRAMNPALADEIAEQKSYERLPPVMAAPPRGVPREWVRRTNPGMVLLAIVLLAGLFSFVKGLATLEPQQVASAQEHHIGVSSNSSATTAW